MRWPPGGDREGARLAPVLAAAFDFEAVLLKAGEGAVDLGADDGVGGRGAGTTGWSSCMRWIWGCRRTRPR